MGTVGSSSIPQPSYLMGVASQAIILTTYQKATDHINELVERIVGVVPTTTLLIEWYHQASYGVAMTYNFFRPRGESKA